jgi:hypothetical protein
MRVRRVLWTRIAGIATRIAVAAVRSEDAVLASTSSKNLVGDPE